MPTDIGTQFDLMCKRHPDRPMVDPYVNGLKKCAACVEEAKDNYAEAMIQRDRLRGYPASSLGTQEQARDGRDIGSEYSKERK